MTNEELFSKHVLSTINRTEPKLDAEGNVSGFNHYINNRLIIEEFFDTKVLFFRVGFRYEGVEKEMRYCLEHFFPSYKIQIIFPSYSG